MSLSVGDAVQINTPGESHHDRTGTVLRIFSTGSLEIDLGDVKWMYRPYEVEAAK